MKYKIVSIFILNTDVLKLPRRVILRLVRYHISIKDMLSKIVKKITQMFLVLKLCDADHYRVSTTAPFTSLWVCGMFR